MKRFLSFLGTGRYQPCRYRFGETTSPEVVYVQTAVNLATAPRCDEADIFCTEGAQAAHADGLVVEFHTHGLPPPRIVPIPDGSSEEQLWEIFRIIRDVVGDGDEIVFDVTHSFRSLPVIATVLLRYLAVAKGVSLVACLYGAWEAKVEADGKAPEAPVFDLTPFFVLDDWTHAIRNFEQFGDASELKRLSLSRLAPLCRTDNAARSLNAAIKQMALFAGNVRISNLGTESGDAGLRAMSLKRCISDALMREGAGEGIPELSPILTRMGAHFADYVDGDLRNGFRAARWAADHGLIPQAYTLLQETAVSLVCDRFRAQLPETLSGVASREFVSGVLGRAVLGENFDWTLWTPAEEAGSARALAESLGQELPQAFARLARRRNAINHAGTNPQEPVSPDCRDFTKEGFLAIAKVLEDSFPPISPAPSDSTP